MDKRCNIKGLFSKPVHPSLKIKLSDRLILPEVPQQSFHYHPKKQKLQDIRMKNDKEKSFKESYR